MKVKVVGAGLAGCEAAWQLAKRGIDVELYEMKPDKYSPAHKNPGFAELVCSNSLRSDRLQNAVGLLKEEMRLLDSLIIRAADHTRVPAGGALAVDRDGFSAYITDCLRSCPNITVCTGELTDIPEGPVIVATGPLTDGLMAENIALRTGMNSLHFFDASAPIVMAESLNMDKVFRASRYGRGEDYLNCPMDRQQYDDFVDALQAAETATVHGFEENMVFEGCMPVESMARRGHMVLAFGPLKPVGLTDPKTGREPYAAVQLRQDDASGYMYNLVGFQTRLKFGEQKRIFGMIPGLENAEFARYGVMHRNTFLHSPGLLDNTYCMINNPDIYFAGQMTGVEGYVESAASGLTAGLALARRLNGKEAVSFGTSTAIGALANYIQTPNKDFQPMNITFGLIDPLDQRIRGKAQRYEMISRRAIDNIRNLIDKYDI